MTDTETTGKRGEGKTFTMKDLREAADDLFGGNIVSADKFYTDLFGDDYVSPLNIDGEEQMLIDMMTMGASE